MQTVMKHIILLSLLMPLMVGAQVRIVDENVGLNIPGISSFVNPNGKILVSEDYFNHDTPDAILADPPFFPNFPLYTLDGVSIRGGVIEDLDNDGENEIIYNFGLYCHAFNLDGTELTGWPTIMDFPNIGAPAVGDVDGDGFNEVVVTTDQYGMNGSIYVFEHTGYLAPGFPISYNGAPMRTPVLANLDDDPELEIVVNIRIWPDAFVYVYNGDGTVVDGWPNQLDYIPGAPCAVGDINNDGEPDVIAVSYWSVYAFEKNGKLMNNFPFTPDDGVRAFSYSSPVLADIDEDGKREIVIGGTTETPQPKNGAVYVINDDGTLVDGWPRYVDSWIFAPVSVADIDDDGHLDIFVGDQVLSPTPANAFYGWNKDGQYIPGFPISQQDAINTQAMIGDLDGDMELEIVYENNLYDGKYFIINHDGTPMELYTLDPVGSTFFNNPTFDDLDKDGKLDITAGIGHVQEGTGDMYAWAPAVTYHEDLMVLRVLQYNNRHTGVYGETGPVGIDDHSATRAFVSVYPNPCSDQLLINLTGEWNGPIQLEIHDLLGRTFVSTEFSWNQKSNPFTIQMPEDSGVYIVRITDGIQVVSNKIVRN
jgi:hypothetical protein